MDGDEAMPAAAAATTDVAPSSLHQPQPLPLPQPQPPLPGSVLSEAATSLLESNKAKRRALGASLESLLATFSGNNAAAGGDAAAAAPSSSAPVDPRFAPLVRRARAQRAALFALSRGMPLSAGLMAAVDGVEVIGDGSGIGGAGRGEPYFYSEPVRLFSSFFSFAKLKRARADCCSGGKWGA